MAIYKDRARKYARTLHIRQKLITFTGTLPYPGSSSSAGGGLWMPRRGAIGRQRRSAVPDGADHVEKTAKNRLPDGNGNRRHRRSHRRIAGQACGRLERNTADGRGIDMAMHFEDQWLGSVPLDDQSEVDRRKQFIREADVNDSTSNRYDRADRHCWIDGSPDRRIRIHDGTDAARRLRP